MAINLVIAVTDGDWFDMLRQQPDLAQVNFWAPSAARRCAITHERTLPALEAAHIRPYGDVGEHEARNGVLLRRDIHSLFDAGYVTVAPDLRFEVSRRSSTTGGTITNCTGNRSSRPRGYRDALIPRRCAGTTNMRSEGDV